MPPKKSTKTSSKTAAPSNSKSRSIKTKASGDADTSQSVFGGTKGGFRLSTKDKSTGPSDPPTFEIAFEGKSIIAQRFPPQDASTSDRPPALVFTHGAGGGITNPATSSFAQGFAREAGIILYQGTMNLQSRVKTCHAVIVHCHGDEAALGGRSMGARAAVLSAKEHKTKELILVSYPLLGQNGDIRDQILLDIDENIDVLFVSGDGDHMCKIEQLNKVRAKMKAKSWLAVVKGADHGMSLKPKEAVEPMREYTGELAAKWLKERDRTRTECTLSWSAGSKGVMDTAWKDAKATKTNSIENAFAKGSKKGKAENDAPDQPSRKRQKKD